MWNNKYLIEIVYRAILTELWTPEHTFMTITSTHTHISMGPHCSQDIGLVPSVPIRKVGRANLCPFNYSFAFVRFLRT